MFRLVSPDVSGNGRTPAQLCEECGQQTRERKPYCSDHIMNHGYAKSLADKMKEVDKELAEVARIGAKAVRLDGLVVEEIVAGIASCGSLTWRRLIKDHVTFLHGADDRVVGCYLKKLIGHRIISVSLSKRGVEVVKLTKRGRAMAGSNRLEVGSYE